LFVFVLERLLSVFVSGSRSSRDTLLSMGDHPAATPAATMPAMTVGAPSAELDRDLIDLDLLRVSGVGGSIEPKLSSRVGV
jgi:hypothetical protein